MAAELKHRMAMTIRMKCSVRAADSGPTWLVWTKTSTGRILAFDSYVQDANQTTKTRIPLASWGNDVKAVTYDPITRPNPFTIWGTNSDPVTANTVLCCPIPLQKKIGRLTAPKRPRMLRRTITYPRIPASQAWPKAGSTHDHWQRDAWDIKAQRLVPVDAVLIPGETEPPQLLTLSRQAPEGLSEAASSLNTRALGANRLNYGNQTVGRLAKSYCPATQMAFLLAVAPLAKLLAEFNPNNPVINSYNQFSTAQALLHEDARSELDEWRGGLNLDPTMPELAILIRHAEPVLMVHPSLSSIELSEREMRDLIDGSVRPVPAEGVDALDLERGELERSGLWSNSRKLGESYMLTTQFSIQIFGQLPSNASDPPTMNPAWQNQLRSKCERKNAGTESQKARKRAKISLDTEQSGAKLRNHNTGGRGKRGGNKRAGATSQRRSTRLK
ncbi:hypothetical protein GGX14DRAFT_608427 [Mycena pura]|uniref:Uncharacterized protein n=1 Tax=Mycena pura TaxID=153505 RepID=A0AAD6VK69_9AGAR|nr:hypothetical protein GGX14DRAFT_608427 [Mycena pura]